MTTHAVAIPRVDPRVHHDQKSPPSVSSDRVNKPIPVDPKDHSGKKRTWKPKPWVKVRLNSADWDAKRIVDNWYVEKRAAPNLAAAIRLYQAVRTGDLDTVRQIAPLLVAALEGPHRKRHRPPIESDSGVSSQKESDSGSEQKEEGARAMVAAICEVCTAVDYALNRRDVDRLAHDLVVAGYTADDVRRWYVEWWRAHDWRGLKGEPPELKDVRKGIRIVKTLPPLPSATPPGDAQNAASSTGIADLPPGGTPAKSAAQADPPGPLGQACDQDGPPDDTPLPQPRPEIAGCWAYQRWIMIRSQLQVVTGGSYRIYLERHRLVDYQELDDRHQFTMTVPRAQHKVWIEKNIADYMRRKLVDFCRRRQPDGTYELPKKVEIVIEVDEYL